MQCMYRWNEPKENYPEMKKENVCRSKIENIKQEKTKKIRKHCVLMHVALIKCIWRQKIVEAEMTQKYITEEAFLSFLRNQ